MNATKTIKKTCKFCKKEFERPNWTQYRRAIFCSYSCRTYYYNSIKDWNEWKKKYTNIISKNRKGKCIGKDNANFGGKYTNTPEIYKKICIANKEKGNSWTEDTKAEHSMRMKGQSNWMRGKHHTEKMKTNLSKIIKQQFSSGKRIPQIHSVNVSKAEIEIMEYIKNEGFKVKPRYVIDGTSYIYDMYIPKLNLLIEYNGDYWHCNPIKYKEDHINSSNKMLAKDIWHRDEIKKNLAINNKYKFITIWENDYKKDKNSLIRKIIYDK